VYVMAIKMKMY